ncbi:MAG: hypothetical protein LUF04_10330 [Bacteroides sp.]|nr:hypothetical protein [Bacteroides sp.]
MDKTLNFLSVMSGKEVDYYLDLPLDQVKEEIKSIEFITHTKAHPRLKDGGIYTIDETRYRLTLNARQMTAGQFIDYENTIESNPGDIAMLCAVFCVPDGKKYGEGYDPLELKAIFFKKFKMVDVMGISFFSKGIANIIRLYPTLFVSEVEKGVKKEKDGSGTEEKNRRDHRTHKISYVWERIIKQIIIYTNLNKYQVFDMNVIEFFNDATFCKFEIMEHNKRQQEKMNHLKKGRRQ